MPFGAARAAEVPEPNAASSAETRPAATNTPSDNSSDVTTLRADIDRLTAEVAALRAKLDGLSRGTIPFEGQIHLPKGWFISKPEQGTTP